MTIVSSFLFYVYVTDLFRLAVYMKQNPVTNYIINDKERSEVVCYFR
jgi:hypothetical protein